MPDAAAIHLDGVPLYHQHPDVLERQSHPPDMQTQTRSAIGNIKLILDHQGLTWRRVVKVTKYLTGMRDMDGMVEELAESFGDWTPGNTTICINSLSTPGARVELDMIALHPKAQGIAAERRLIRATLEGELLLEGVTLLDLERADQILQKYSDANIGLVDATAVAIAERLGIHLVVTTDRRHFSLFRPKHCRTFELLP